MIVLTGFRASGKTTIGKFLAMRLNVPFIDMDAEIVRISQQSIKELTENGTVWQPFREREQSLLRALLPTKNAVISTGGGVLVNSVINPKTNKTYGEENRVLLQGATHVKPFVLTADVELLCERIGQAEDRPIVDAKKAEEIKNLLQYTRDPEEKRKIELDALMQTERELYRVRKPLYEALSPYIFDTGRETKEAIVDKIETLVTSYD